jgi:hypothetical protein
MPQTAFSENERRLLVIPVHKRVLPFLITNHILKSAIRLYESLGFHHVDLKQVRLSPYSRADVYVELLLS